MSKSSSHASKRGDEASASQTLLCNPSTREKESIPVYGSTSGIWISIKFLSTINFVKVLIRFGNTKRRKLDLLVVKVG